MTLCDSCPYRSIPQAMGDLKVDGVNATWREQPLDLTPGEYRVVTALAMRPGVRSFRDVYDAVQRPGFIAGRGDNGFRTNVRSAIKRLRIKFRSVDPEFNCIKVVSGIGYRWDEP